MAAGESARAQAGNEPAPGTDLLADVRIVRASAERLDEIEPLWLLLHYHHVAISDPRRGEVRPAEESWQIKRGWYEEWLAQPGSYFLIAELREEPVGYAIVRTVPGDPTPTWYPPERKGEIEAVSVHPRVHSLGVGAMLSAAVKYEAWRIGLPALGGAIIAGNEAAIRFYEREGAYLTYVSMEMPFDEQSPPPPVPIVDHTASSAD